MTPRSPLADVADEELLRRLVRGDTAAAEALIRRYERALFNFVLRSVRDREVAADLSQDVFLRMVQRAEEFKGDSKFSTWLFAIARNSCIDHARRSAHRRHASLDAPARSDEAGVSLIERVAGQEIAAERGAASIRSASAIAEAVESLPEDQREVFLLREIEDLSFKEIATIVGAPENTVKSRMRYALERLRAALTEHYDGAKGVRDA